MKISLRTPQEAADKITEDNDECQNTYCVEAIRYDRMEIAKIIRDLIERASQQTSGNLTVIKSIELFKLVKKLEER